MPRMWQGTAFPRKPHQTQTRARREHALPRVRESPSVQSCSKGAHEDPHRGETFLLRPLRHAIRPARQPLRAFEDQAPVKHTICLYRYKHFYSLIFPEKKSIDLKHFDEIVLKYF